MESLRGVGAQEELRAQLAAIVDSSDDAIIGKDLDGLITSWNAGATRIYGYTAEEVVGRPISILVPEEQADEIPGILERLRRGERIDHYETVRKAKDGRHLHISLTVSPIRDGAGRVTGASAVGREITEAKQARAAMAKELRAYRRLQEISTRLVPAADVRLLYAELLDAAIEIVGSDRGTMQSYDAEKGELHLLEARGMPGEIRTTFDRIASGAGTSCGRALGRRERVVVDYETDESVRGTEDARIHLEAGIRAAQSTPLISRSGRMVGMLTTHWNGRVTLSESQENLLDILARQAADLIERAEAEEALRRSERSGRLRNEQFETLLGQAPLGVYLVDADFRIQQVNPVAAEVFQGPLERVIGRDFGDVLHEMWDPGRAGEIEGIFRHTLETGEPFHAPEFQEERADRGAREYYDWRVERIVLPDGRHGAVCYFREISEQVRARLEIERSEVRYRTLFDSIEEGFAVVEIVLDDAGRPTDYRFLETNPAFQRHTGLVDAVGKRARELLPDLEHRWIEAYGRIAETGRSARFVDHSPVMNRWFEVEAFRVGEPEQRRVAMLFSDITDRRRAEEALRESERRERERADELAALMDSVPAVVFLAHDREGRRITGSRRAHEFLRVPFEGNLSRSAEDSERPEHFRVLVAGRELPAEELPVQRAARGEPMYDQELEIRFDDGTVSYLFGSAIPVFDDRGEARGAIAAMIDITDRKRAEQALHRSEERLRLAKAAAGLGIHDYNVATGQIGWDRRTRELWGADSDEPVTYELWLEGIHPEDRERAEGAVRRSLDPEGDGVYFDAYRVINRKDGLTRWVEASGQATFSDGHAVRLVGTIQDITESKRAEEALREADRRKDEFLATLAHELRSPLAAIRTAQSVLEASRDDPAQVGEMSAVMERQSSHLVRLVDDLLDVSRISLGKVKLEREPIDVATMARQVASDCRAECEAKGLALSVIVPEEEIRVEADPVRLAQVTNNLVQNACKFTDPGGEVRIAVARNGGEALVSVADTGVGIGREHLSRIFELFVQGGSDLGREEGGLGIGLSLSRSIVEMHGGRLEARSEGHGKGSEFTVRLPALPRGDGEEAKEGSTDSGVRNRPEAGCRIVLAEDHADALHVMSLMLEMRGHEVEMAKDGVEALEKIRALRPPVAILDIGMPEMDGYEVARRVREESWGASIFLIALTGWGEEKDRHRAIEAGFDRHLTKPVDPDVLAETLQSLE